MRYGRNHLFVPGPTNVPHSVLSAMHVPMEDHRASDLPELTQPLFADLNKVFKTTSGQSFIFPATGTAGWEVALANTLSPGDKVLSARFGQFSWFVNDNFASFATANPLRSANCERKSICTGFQDICHLAPRVAVGSAKRRA